MSQFSDSRAPNGIGILILQHTDYDKKNFSLDLRGGLLAVRVLDRDDRITGTEPGLGNWEYDDTSAGDINGGFLWPNTNSRPIPGWAFAWPTKLRGGSTGTPTIAAGGGPGAPPPQFQDVETPSNQGMPQPPPPGTPMDGVGKPGQITNNTNHNCGVMFNVHMIPVRGTSLDADTRYKELEPRFPRSSEPRGRIWPKMPRGHFGIGLTATNEERQIEYFHPTDPRLVSVNFGGDPACGSLICDLKADHNYDETRTARLQGFTWVVKQPDG